MNQYEAMFLFDPTFGGSFENCEAEIRRLMERAGAEVLFCRLWDERRLAYKIRGRKRGVYVLTYFKAAPEKITPLERDAQLSEDILRMLVLRADGVTLEAMEKAVASRPDDRAGDRGRGNRSGDQRQRDREPTGQQPDAQAPEKEKPEVAVDPADEVADHKEDDLEGTAEEAESRVTD